MNRSILMVAMLVIATTAAAQADDMDLAKKVANPVADLISLPFQFNGDCCYGPERGARFTLNIQPVVPLPLADDWKLIVRTILPVVQQGQTAPRTGDTFGLGDTTQSFFFVPPSPEIIVGFGPAFLWPTDTSPVLGSRKWGAGPTMVVIKQTAGWTFGLLTNHIWSYSGGGSPANVDATFLQPFLSYTYPDTTSVGLNSEATYDWTAQKWTAPINVTLSKIFKFGEQPVSLGITGRYYAITPPDGPRWGARFTANFLFPAA